MKKKQNEKIWHLPGADWGGGGLGLIRHPRQPKGPPSGIIYDNRQPNKFFGHQTVFFGRQPNKFLKAPLVPLDTNFEGGARAKKRYFFVKMFEKKCWKLVYGTKLFKLGRFIAFLEFSENQIGRPKK